MSARRDFAGALLLSLILLGSIVFQPRAVASPQGAALLLWVPTFDQALEMARHTRRPIFLMYYTLFDERVATFGGKGAVC